MQDIEIIELYLKRDEKAIEESDRKYGIFVNRIAAKLLDDDRDLEECVSDVWVSLWKQIPPNNPTNFKAYVAKIARNLSIKKFEYNRASKRDMSLEVSFDEIEEIMPDKDIHKDIDDGAISKAISNFLRKENQINRNIFVLKYFYFESIEDIANKYDFSESKVKSILFRTRNKLKNHLKKEGIRI